MLDMSYVATATLDQGCVCLYLYAFFTTDVSLLYGVNTIQQRDELNQCYSTNLVIVNKIFLNSTLQTILNKYSYLISTLAHINE